MSTVTITLLKTVDVSQPNAAKKYKQMVVTHQEVGKDKPDGKKLFDFTTPKEVWDTLLAAPAGATFEVDRQKDAKEGKYWEWKAIRAATAPSVAAASQTTSSSAPATSTAGTKVGNWETPEERAKKQIYIVRQSTINAAIAYFSKEAGDVSVDDVLQVARQFEDYVFDNGVAGLTDDQPE